MLERRRAIKAAIFVVDVSRFLLFILRRSAARQAFEFQYFRAVDDYAAVPCFLPQTLFAYPLVDARFRDASKFRGFVDGDELILIF